MKHIIRIKENELCNLIKESLLSTLNEAKGIKSSKLYDIVQKHKGILSNYAVFDIHNLTDDDVVGVITYKQWVDIVEKGIRNFAQEHGINLHSADTLYVIELNDGNYVLCVLRGGNYDRIAKSVNAERKKTPGDFEFFINKKVARERNRYPGKDEYVWNNKDADDLFHNPFFRRNEGNWTQDRKSEAVSNVKNNRRWFERK
jgi:hypothetical protein